MLEVLASLGRVELKGGAWSLAVGVRAAEEVGGRLAERVFAVWVVVDGPPQGSPAPGAHNSSEFGQAGLLVNPVERRRGDGKVEPGFGQGGLLECRSDHIHVGARSEERGVGKECRSRWSP